MTRVFGVLWMLLLAFSPAIAQEPADEAAAPDPDPVAAPAEQATETTDSTAEADDRFVVICPIEDEIDEAMAVIVERAVQSAEGAEALLFVIDTPGGRVDSAIDITSAIMSVECPTMAFIVDMGAISAGALISYACDYIYMAPGTNIGASTPIMPGVETTEAMDEKSNSVVRAKYRALGEANGHDPLLGEAMVDRNMEVRAYRNDDGTYTIFEVPDGRGSSDSEREGDLLDRILDEVSEGEGNEEIGDLLRKVLGAGQGDDRSLPAPEREQRDEYQQFLEGNTELVSARGELLTMTSEEAVHFGLAEAVTTDVDDTLREHLLGSVNRLEITPTWEEALFAFLTSPTIAGLLLMVGLGGLYVEARTPGFGAPGIIGATCLALFFGAHMVLGMANWIDVALIIAGFLLILAEVFLLPGFGIAGILGVACLLGGSYLALVKVPIPEYTWDVVHMQDAMYTLTITMVSLIAFIVISGLILPYTPLASALVLGESQQAEAGYIVQNPEEARQTVGLTGTATSPLRPSGRGRFGNKTYDIVTRGEFIAQGTPIQIIESSGNRYVVTEIKTEEHT